MDVIGASRFEAFAELAAQLVLLDFAHRVSRQFIDNDECLGLFEAGKARAENGINGRDVRCRAFLSDKHAEDSFPEVGVWNTDNG